MARSKTWGCGLLAEARNPYPRLPAVTASQLSCVWQSSVADTKSRGRDEQIYKIVTGYLWPSNAWAISNSFA